jgi:hypothetical protein
MAGKRRAILVLAATAALAVVAYLPALGLPFIADDYLQIALARQYGPVSGWADLAADPLYRCRATSLVLTWWLEQLAGVNPLPFNLVSLGLHIVNTWLVFALGLWKPIGWRVSAAAAAFFAVYEGHQEAVVWFAAVPELLVFTFSLASLLVWLIWLQRGQPGWTLPLGAGAFFLLALLSKESAAVLPGLFLLTVLVHPGRWKRIAAASAPMLLISGLYTLMAFGAKTSHQHFNDGTFSTTSPVWVTLANSTGRMLWFWGLLALVAILWRRSGQWRPLLAIVAVWVIITFLPYSFIAYMPRVPSRHTYLASAGLSVLIGFAFLLIARQLSQWRAWAPAALAAVVVLHNCGYLWGKKQSQYLARAEPTEQLIKAGLAHPGPIRVRCFPYSPTIALTTLQVAAKHDTATVLFDEPAADSGIADFCYDRMP